MWRVLRDLPLRFRPPRPSCRHRPLGRPPGRHGLADTMPEEPRGLHAAIEHPLNLPGRNAFLAGAHEVDDLQPKVQRQMRGLENVRMRTVKGFFTRSTCGSQDGCLAALGGQSVRSFPHRRRHIPGRPAEGAPRRKRRRRLRSGSRGIQNGLAIQNSKVVIGVPLPTAPPGFQWRSLGRWIDFHNAGSAPEMGRKASSDQPSPRRRPKRKSLRRRRIEGPAS